MYEDQPPVVEIHSHKLSGGAQTVYFECRSVCSNYHDALVNYAGIILSIMVGINVSIIEHNDLV